MTAPSDFNFENTAELAQKGSSAAVNKIIQNMRPTVEMIAMKYISSQLEKDDLVQEGMIGLLAAVRSYRPGKGASFKTFACICIENSIQTALRKFKRIKDIPQESMVSYEDYLKTLGSADSAEDDFLASESVRLLTEELERVLSGFEYEVLRLHIVGCSYSEIAKRLGKTSKAVDNALQRIRKKLLLLFE